ncbi:exported protein of unknown function [Streptomyces ambofaciens ATCC 23877]|uniref:Uncharacterized protein n=1 Tax=Streptomyces ambofaciens (strain ATCC 23877 / 3486 / DSM 40053 / JCM 4204 / NBRC 12836 / NRRL B-2516) TaxID=278992 RepID=A0A0K2AV83_STRA7|nr:DUF732 domain-containing protein [Streptomyces ambofaciens]AKZ56929.1 exported protein of unknown function [Streptomyces ambofaciens ATCC 23877]
MRKRTAVAVSGLVTAAVTVAAVAFGGGGDGDDGTSDTEHSRTIGAGEQHVVPSPDAGQRELLLDDLEAIGSGLVADEDQAVEDARWICVDIRRGQPEDEVRGVVLQRFRVTWEQTGSVLDAIRGTFC